MVHGDYVGVCRNVDDMEVLSAMQDLLTAVLGDGAGLA